MLTDKPKEDAGHVPVALGSPATAFKALFGNTAVKATAEVRCCVDSLAGEDGKVGVESGWFSSEHPGLASGHHCRHQSWH